MNRNSGNYNLQYAESLNFYRHDFDQVELLDQVLDWVSDEGLSGKILDIHISASEDGVSAAVTVERVPW